MSQDSKQLSLHDFEETFSSLPIGHPFDAIQIKNHQELSLELSRRGEMRLLQGDVSGKHYFELAIKLNPANHNLYYQQGLALFQYGIEENSLEDLRLASKRFKMATRLNPDFFEAFHVWGNTLYLIGQASKNLADFMSAKRKYQKAIKLSELAPPDILADLFIDYGDIWKKLAEYSGEANDLHLALKSYDQASMQREDLHLEFWIHYGDVALVLGKQTNDLQLFVKAINCYKNAISIEISTASSWLSLAKALRTLYRHTHDEDHFSQADECFGTALQLLPNNAEIYLEWAITLFESGKLMEDTKRLRSSIEQAERAHHHDRNNTKILAIWTEALAELGLINEDLELIHEGENKIIEAIEKEGETPHLCHAHGMALFAQAQYFNDLDLYYLAIEKFQAGLSMDRTQHKLWFAIGLSYTIVGQIEDDQKAFERADRFFQKALNFQGNSLYHFYAGDNLIFLAESYLTKESLKAALYHFEAALNIQKNASYLHPDWLYRYAVALDMMGDLSEEEERYAKALEILNHVLMVDPEFPEIHHQIALTLGHFGELTGDPELFHKSFHHYRIANQRERENDQIILDWAITLINLADSASEPHQSDAYFREAEYKLIQSAKLGNAHAYYHLAGLYSLLEQYERALGFLEKAHRFDALPPIHELLKDDWLENLRGTEMFQSFLSNVSKD